MWPSAMKTLQFFLGFKGTVDVFWRLNGKTRNESKLELDYKFINLIFKDDFTPDYE